MVKTMILIIMLQLWPIKGLEDSLVGSIVTNTFLPSQNAANGELKTRSGPLKLIQGTDVIMYIFT